MYICPTCGKEVPTEQEIVKHFLACWKEHNPRHKSKEAPHSEDIVNKRVGAEVQQFFAQFKES